MRRVVLIVQLGIVIYGALFDRCIERGLVSRENPAEEITRMRLDCGRRRCHAVITTLVPSTRFHLVTYHLTRDDLEPLPR
jgi:hypothetical protein